jgi:predicted RNase H-like HicB family nuclease
MAQRRFRTNLVVRHEEDEAGWIRATLPAMPTVATAGVSREDAREIVIDALMQLLGIEPERQNGGDYERVRLDVSTGGSAQRTAGRTRPKSPPRPEAAPMVNRIG